ncbi:MAG: peptidoglycan binding domain-containing protein [Oscillospiraceae bacterium]|nr:peptidoglycan binding domain-containing protein [Oscillospiraceae bacterium]
MPTETKIQKGSPLLVALSVILGLLLILAGIFAGISSRYEEMFLPGTSINGVDVSGMDISQVQYALEAEQGAYSLTLIQRDGVTETITAADINLILSFDNSLKDLLEEQNNWSWPLALLGLRQNKLEAATVYSYDTALLTEAISNLKCMNTGASSAPRNAYLSDFNPEIGGVEVVPETLGTQVKPEVLLPAIQNAVANMQTELDLEEAGCYVEAEITADDPELNLQAQRLNEYLGIEITYEFGPDTVVLNGSQLQDWITFEPDGTPILDKGEVTAFVRNLAYNYNTIFSDRTFMTSYGQEIEVEGGDYGWWMDETAEVEELYQQILNKESGLREPVWKQKAKAFGDPDRDFGTTYVEVNLTAQHLFFYKDGQLMLESDFVSGRAGDRATPTGTYGILYCERYATLSGESYSSPVSYWMPFYNGVGLHDAPWRTTFGGTIYKTSGSHGCVNLPIDVAKYLWENVNTGTGVIVYELEGTEDSNTESQSYEEIASAIVDALDEISSEGEITSSNYSRMSKRIKWVQAAYSKLSASAQSRVTNYDLLSKAVSALNCYEAAN